jgi:hypothetical protein
MMSRLLATGANNLLIFFSDEKFFHKTRKSTEKITGGFALTYSGHEKFRAARKV